MPEEETQKLAKRAFKNGWGTRIQNSECRNQKSGALPLGDTPIVVLRALVGRASLKTLAGVRFEPPECGISYLPLGDTNKLFSNRSEYLDAF